MWSPTSKNEIRRTDWPLSVQRRFTKRITGMSNMSYYSGLKELQLESLELRRFRTDLLTVYKILFGLLNTSTDVFFTLRAQAHLHGHPYTLDKQRCTNYVRQSFLGRLPKVDLIILEGKMSVRPYVRTSVRPSTKSFFRFE